MYSMVPLVREKKKKQSGTKNEDHFFLLLSLIRVPPLI